MSYIGNEPIVSATRTITEVTATAGQTVFTPNGGYTVGYIDVFVNGAQLQTSDFTATDGSTITLVSGATAGDGVRLVAWGTFQSANLNGAALLDGTVTAAKFASGQTPSFNGITFPATQVASANANTLDDYEEGTWTPTVSAGVTSPSYAVQNGRYRKVGSLVVFQLNIALNGGTANGSQFTISGLPFIANATNISGAYFAYINGTVNNTTLPTAFIGPSAGFIVLYGINGNNFNGTSFISATSTNIYITGTYNTD